MLHVGNAWLFVASTISRTQNAAITYRCPGILEGEPRREVSTYIIYSKRKLKFIRKISLIQVRARIFLFQHTKMANWYVPIDKLLNCIMCSRKVITNDLEKQFVPQRFIFSPWFPIGSAVLITMLCNFIAVFLLKAQIWVDMAYRKLHRWCSTVSTVWLHSSFDLLINVPISRLKTNIKN